MSSASNLDDLLLFDSEDQQTNDADITTHLAPLPPVNLPAFPGPTASPSSSKLSLRSSGQPSPSAGLDMNKGWPSSPSRQHSYGQAGGDDLEEVSGARWTWTWAGVGPEESGSDAGQAGASWRSLGYLESLTAASKAQSELS